MQDTKGAKDSAVNQREFLKSLQPKMKTKKWGEVDKRASLGMENSMLNRMVKESLAKKIILEQLSEGREGENLANVWRKGVLGRENRQ